MFYRTISKTRHDKDFIGVTAYLENGALHIVEQELSEAAREYSRDGEIESYVFFTKSNTARLSRALGARDSIDLLYQLQRRFGKFGSCAKCEICDFCDSKGIAYTRQVYY